MFQRLLYCSRGKHARMRRYAKRRGEDFVSRCRGCGIELVRNSDAIWVSREVHDKELADAASRRN